MLRELASVATVFLTLSASAGIGILIRPRLPAHHRGRETVEVIQVAIGLLATFAALVLGLLTASVKQSYERTAQDWEQYALQLTLLNDCLRDIGTGGDTARGQIRSYTAAVIASTWPSEPAPVGVSYPDTSGMPVVGATPVLSKLINQVGLELSRLTPADSAGDRIVGFCVNRFREVSNARLHILEDAPNDLLRPFYIVLVFWLMIIFVCFGLAAPKHGLSLLIVVLCAVSLTSVMFVISDLSHPYDGFFSIDSSSMRHALDSMLAAG